MEHMMLVLDLVSVALILATLVILALNVRDFWGMPMAEAFIYYGSAMLLIGLIKIFHHLADSHTLAISEATVTVGWHLMFYLSMSLFIAGTAALLRLIGLDGSAPAKFSRILVRGYAPVLAGVVVFFGAILADGWITAAFGASLFDRIGVVHFLAFIISAGVVRAMLHLRKSLGLYVSSIATPIIWAVVFLGLVHLWELLLESWHLFTVPEGVGEFVEVVLTLPALVLVFYAFLRTRRKVSQETVVSA